MESAELELSHPKPLHLPLDGSAPGVAVYDKLRMAGLVGWTAQSANEDGFHDWEL